MCTLSFGYCRKCKEGEGREGGRAGRRGVDGVLLFAPRKVKGTETRRRKEKGYEERREPRKKERKKETILRVWKSFALSGELCVERREVYGLINQIALVAPPRSHATRIARL